MLQGETINSKRPDKKCFIYYAYAADAALRRDKQSSISKVYLPRNVFDGLWKSLGLYFKNFKTRLKKDDNARNVLIIKNVNIDRGLF